MFTPRSLTHLEDLSANRSGQITARQRRSAWSALGLLESGVLLFVGIVAAPTVAFPAIVTVLTNDNPWIVVSICLFATAVVAPVALLTARLVARIVLVALDLSEGHVISVDGAVAWRRRRYVADFPERRAWSADNSAHGLTPGAYRFYILPRSHHVLSAQALALYSFETPNLAAVLQTVFGIGPEDAMLNRQGQLTPRQATRLLRSAAGQSALMVALLAMASVATIPALRAREQVETLIFAGIGAIVLVGIAVVIGVNIGRTLLDTRGGDVRSLSGMVTTRATGGRTRTYYYVVDKEHFQVSQAAYAALIPTRRYRLYYAPRSRQIVAMEPEPERVPSTIG